ncbi:MAG: B12-binding domain-containing radical SAM protein [Clostridia bacterium]
MSDFKLLLVNPPTLTEIPKFGKGYSYYEWLKIRGGGKNYYENIPGEHLGLQCISSFLSSKGYKLEILNACVENHRSLDETLESIKNEYPFNMIAFSGPYSVFSEVCYLAQAVKELFPDVPIIYGHHFATLNYEKIMKKYECFDYICLGEGEYPLYYLANALENKKPIKDVPSIVYREGDEIIASPYKCFLEEVIEIKPVRTDAHKVLNSNLSLSIFASRGCPYTCSFCTTGSLSRKYKKHDNWKLRDPYSFVDELEELYENFSIDRVTIIDDTFATNTPAGKQQAEIIAKEIIKRNIKLFIMFDTRVDCVDKDLFSLLYKAGFKKVFLGIESASDLNLKIYNKGFSKIS